MTEDPTNRGEQLAPSPQPVPKAIGALTAMANGMDRLALDAAPYEAEHLHGWARTLRAITKDLGSVEREQKQPEETS